MGSPALNITLVYNPAAGTAPPLDDIRRMCQTHNISIDHVIDVTVNFPDSLLPYLAPDVLIAAIGGDGTLSAVAQHLHGSGAIFIPLPGGTFNHFTKDAGISQNLNDVFAHLATRSPRKVDVGVVNGHVFLNNSSLGIYPTSLRVRQQVEQTLGKWPSAVIGVIRALIQFKLYTVTMEGETFRTPFIFIGNNNYDLDNGGRRDSLTSGMLSAYTIRSTRRRSLVGLLVSALFRKLHDSDKLVVHRDTEIIIETKRARVLISTDGEVVQLTSPLHYKLLPQSLTILG